jgi:hypothetical protein
MSAAQHFILLRKRFPAGQRQRRSGCHGRGDGSMGTYVLAHLNALGGGVVAYIVPFLFERFLVVEMLVALGARIAFGIRSIDPVDV